MAGLIWNTTDLDTTYSFKIKRDGVSVGSAIARRITIDRPGIDGKLYQNLEFDERAIVIIGYIIGSSHSDMDTKWKGLEIELYGSLQTEPVSFSSPTRTEKTLTIPTFAGIKFPYCSCVEISPPNYLGAPRILAKVCELTLKFFQSKPCTIAV